MYIDIHLHSLAYQSISGVIYTLSKAFFKSKKTEHTSSPSSRLCGRSWVTVSRAEVVDLPDIKPHCRRDEMVKNLVNQDNVRSENNVYIFALQTAVCGNIIGILSNPISVSLSDNELVQKFINNNESGFKLPTVSSLLTSSL